MDRNGKIRIEVIDEDEITSNHQFYKQLSDTTPDEEDDKKQKHLNEHEKQLFR